MPLGPAAHSSHLMQHVCFNSPSRRPDLHVIVSMSCTRGVPQRRVRRPLWPSRSSSCLTGNRPGVDKCNHTAATSHYILGCRGRLRTAAMWTVETEQVGFKKKNDDENINTVKWRGRHSLSFVSCLYVRIQCLHLDYFILFLLFLDNIQYLMKMTNSSAI